MTDILNTLVDESGARELARRRVRRGLANGYQAQGLDTL